MVVIIIFVFALGYLAIALEHSIKVNKAASALLVGVICWSLYVTNVKTLLPIDAIPQWYASEAHQDNVNDIGLHYAIDVQHLHLTGETASILFFLMGAMTIVELVDSHEGFALITKRIRARRKSSLLWIVGIMTFFMSSVLDNLTTTIVMVSCCASWWLTVRTACDLWDSWSSQRMQEELGP